METLIESVAIAGNTGLMYSDRNHEKKVLANKNRLHSIEGTLQIFSFLFIFLFFLISFSGNGQVDVFYPGFFQDRDVFYFEYQQSWNTEGLKGSVKSVKEMNFKGDLSYGEVAKSNLADIRHKVYNPNGKIVEYSVYDTSGKFNSKSTGKYDAAGNLTEWDKFDANGNLIFKIIYTYRYELKKRTKDKIGLVSMGNFNGNSELIIEETSFSFNLSINDFEPVSQSVSRYNAEKKLIERSVKNADGSKEKETISYRDGNISHKVEVCDASGTLAEKKIIKYASNESVEEKLVIRKNNVIVDRKKYQEGNLVKQNVYNQDGELIVRKLFNYRSPGLPFVLSTYDARSGLTSRTFVKYDQYGQPTEFHSFVSEKKEEDTKGNIKTTYDSKGNWVKQVNVINGGKNAISIVEREIEYF